LGGSFDTKIDMSVSSPFIPLSFPVIAGSGSITGILVLSTIVAQGVIFIAVLVALCGTAIILNLNSEKIAKALGEDNTCQF